MKEEIKKEIALIQIDFLKAIKSHQECYGKLQDGGDSTALQGELKRLREIMKDCETRQRILIDQIQTNTQNIEYKFNLYNNMQRSTIPGKKRRRKDNILSLKDIAKKQDTRAQSKSRSPSPAESSESCLSSDGLSDDDFSQSSQPVPLPRARSKLFPDKIGLVVSRRDVRLPKLRRKIKENIENYNDPELFKNIPFYHDPPPSPEPVDESERKLKFMAALNLIPTESVKEILIKKTERKRRSTANPHFLYYDDGEPSNKKKVKQYLSPIKITSPLSAEKLQDVKRDGKEKKIKLEIKKLDVDSSQGIEIEPGITKCQTCEKPATLLECDECTELFHPKCESIPLVEQSFLLCRRCRRLKRGSVESEESQDNSCEASKEGEFKSVFEKRMAYRNKLVAALQARAQEKAELEEKILKIFESRMLQHKLNKDLEREATETTENIEKMRKFVQLFQMIDGKPKPETKIPTKKEDEISALDDFDSLRNVNDGEVLKDTDSEVKTELPLIEEKISAAEDENSSQSKSSSVSNLFSPDLRPENADLEEDMDTERTSPVEPAPAATNSSISLPPKDSIFPADSAGILSADSNLEENMGTDESSSADAGPDPADSSEILCVKTTTLLPSDCTSPRGDPGTVDDDPNEDSKSEKLHQPEAAPLSTET